MLIFALMSISAQISHAPLRLIGRMPLKAHYANARFLAWLIGDVIRYRRDVVSFNLARCFPEKTTRELKELRKEAYRHFADIVVESFWFGACRDPRRLHDARIVEIANPEVISALFESSPSVAVLYSHCGNWELYGGIESYNYSGNPMPITEQNFSVVYKRTNSKTTDEVLRMNRFAPLKDRDGYNGYVETRDLIRYAFTHKAEKRIYNINTDQRPYVDSGANIPVRFLGQDTQTMTGAAAIARKFGMAVCYLRMERKERGHYIMEYVPICANAAESTVEAIMTRYYELLEDDIRKDPANYLWTHKRFK